MILSGRDSFRAVVVLPRSGNPMVAGIGIGICLGVSKDFPCVLAEQMKGLSLYKRLLKRFFRHSSFIKLRKGFKEPNKSTPPIQIRPGPVVIKLFSYSTQLSTKFILLINIKMPTIVGILTFISMINKTAERLKARNFFLCWYFSFYEQLKFHAQLS